MRIVLTFVALVSAVLVPWSSLAPAWLPDASGSAISPNTKPKGPAARISCELGILPLTNGDEPATEPEQPAAEPAAVPHPPHVVCENGVCRLVSDSDDSPPTASPQLEQARSKLAALGATQIRIDQDPAGDWRCSCSVAVNRTSKVVRRFEATGHSGDEAAQQACTSVQAWLQDHR